MPHRRRRRSTRLATQAIELGLAVPEVVAGRVARMALAGASPSAADRAEMLRMSAEKVGAFYESWNSMLVAAHRANVRLLLSAPWWSAVYFGQHHRASSEVHRSALDVLASGLAPIHRRVIGNVKRLRR